RGVGARQRAGPRGARGPGHRELQRRRRPRPAPHGQGGAGPSLRRRDRAPAAHQGGLRARGNIVSPARRVSSAADRAMTNVKRAVFPAAGLGTRFLPATKAQPKEMLPLVDKPTIQYVVEEAVASGLSEIILVTGRNKRAIEDHFDAAFELEYYLQDRRK